jgi:ribose transport system permease protein
MTERIPDSGGRVAAAGPGPAADALAPAPSRRRLRLGLEKYSGLYVWAIVIIVFSIWEPNTFPTFVNVKVLAANQAITAILALALVVPVAAGVFDLSVAGILGFALMGVAWLQQEHVNALLATLLILVTGAAIGAVNGFVVVRLHVDSFITTLGMSSILAAAAYAVSGGQQITGVFSPTFESLGQRQIGGIPIAFIYMVVLALVLWYVLEYRPVGRYLYAAGGNPQAARLAGVRVERLVFGSFITSGTLAALAGIILAAQIGTADVSSGPPYLLPAFAAVFLGATQIRVGQVNVPGTLVAIFLLATGVTGLQLAGAPVYVEDLFNGTALIVAVALAVRGQRRSAGTKS